MFTDIFVSLRQLRKEMHIVIVAGNHDSASRLQSHSRIWEFADIKIVGTPPPLDFMRHDGWEEDFILRLESGYVITLPYFASDRTEAARWLQEYVERENRESLPVVMTAHLAVTGSDFTGHDSEIGMLRAVDIEKFGKGYDYLALGHIHCPQTLGHKKYERTDTMVSPVARYSGSPLHVSCDETYPHSVSLVDIDSHHGEVKIKELFINQLRHFYNLPLNEEKFDDQKHALKYISRFINENNHCYIRMKVDSKAYLSPDFNNQVYQLIEESGKDIRYNPKIIWLGEENCEDEKPTEIEQQLAVEELQQMTNPLDFIRLTSERYTSLDISSLSSAFQEIENELKRMDEEESEKTGQKKKSR